MHEFLEPGGYLYSDGVSCGKDDCEWCEFADLVRIFGQIKNPSELKSEDL